MKQCCSGKCKDLPDCYEKAWNKHLKKMEKEEGIANVVILLAIFVLIILAATSQH
jgi:hypothetical protein